MGTFVELCVRFLDQVISETNTFTIGAATSTSLSSTICQQNEHMFCRHCQHHCGNDLHTYSGIRVILLCWFSASWKKGFRRGKRRSFAPIKLTLKRKRYKRGFSAWIEPGRPRPKGLPFQRVTHCADRTFKVLTYGRLTLITF